MAKFELRIKPGAVKELEALGSIKIRQRIVKRIRALADDPHAPGSQKLSGDEKYRVRVGPYRILYTVDHRAAVLTVVKIAHRKDVYR